MMIHRNKPMTTFDTETGMLIRETNEKPYAPELIDMKVTNMCNAGCPFCYQNSVPTGKHADFKYVCEQMDKFTEPPFQIAVGGGEPTLWPHLNDFITFSHARNIVVNTAVGPCPDTEMLRKVAPRMGAIGVSLGYYTNRRQLHQFRKTVKIIKDSGGKAFAHIVLSKRTVKGIQAAITEGLLTGIECVVFLTYKPVGMAEKMDDTIPSVDEVDSIIATCIKKKVSIAFDSCFDAYVRLRFRNPLTSSSCDGGMFSMYWNAVEQKVGQCSFLAAKETDDVGDAWKDMTLVPPCKLAFKTGAQ